MQRSTPDDQQLHWDDIRYFVVACDAGSFSAAARTLGIEQSTISRRIKRLETALQLPLFERHPEGLRPTEAAQPLLVHARAAAANMDALQRAAASPSLRGGRVRVACTAAMADLMIMPAMQSFLGQHPEIRLDLETGLDFVDLARGDADIALRNRRATDASLASRKLATLRFAPFATADYARRHAATPLRELDWLVVRGSVLETQWFEAHVGIEPRVTTQSFKEQLEAVRRGLGVGLIAHQAALGFDELVEMALPALPEPPAFELWLVTHADRRAQPHIRTVIDWLVELTATMPQPRA